MHESHHGSKADALFASASRRASTDGLPAAQAELEAAALAGHPVAARAALSLALRQAAGPDATTMPALLTQLLEGPPSRGPALLLAAEWARFHQPPGGGDRVQWAPLLAEAYAAGDPQAREWVALEGAWLGASAPAMPSPGVEPVLEYLRGTSVAWASPPPQVLVAAEGVRVTLVRAFAPALALDRAKQMLAPRLAPSLVVDPRTGQRVSHPVRDAHQAQWLPEMLGWHGKLLEQRLAVAGAYPRGCGEVTNLLRYGAGQRYRAHLDCLPRDTVRSADGQQQGGQRVLTQLLGVVAPTRGGDTHFERLGVAVSLGPGDLLSFDNADKDGQALPASRHEGLAVVAGQKWILSKWVRQTTTPYGRELPGTF